MDKDIEKIVTLANYSEIFKIKNLKTRDWAKSHGAVEGNNSLLGDYCVPLFKEAGKNRISVSEQGDLMFDGDPAYYPGTIVTDGYKIIRKLSTTFGDKNPTYEIDVDGKRCFAVKLEKGNRSVWHVLETVKATGLSNGDILATESLSYGEPISTIYHDLMNGCRTMANFTKAEKDGLSVQEIINTIINGGVTSTTQAEMAIAKIMAQKKEERGLSDFYNFRKEKPGGNLFTQTLANIDFDVFANEQLLYHYDGRYTWEHMFEQELTRRNIPIPKAEREKTAAKLRFLKSKVQVKKENEPEGWYCTIYS